MKARGLFRQTPFRFLAALCLLAGPVAADPFISLIGSSGVVGDGNLSVAIGQSNGWGFQILNDSATQWLAANLSDFCPVAVDSPPCDSNTWFLSGGVDTFGPYTDLFGPNFVVVAPLQTLTQQFVDGVSGAGSIALTRLGINVGDAQSGHVVFVYDVFDGDPNAGGGQIGGDQFAFANATVTAVGATPEPSTLWLVGLGWAGFILRPKRLFSRCVRRA